MIWMAPWQHKFIAVSARGDANRFNAGHAGLGSIDEIGAAGGFAGAGEVADLADAPQHASLGCHGRWMNHRKKQKSDKFS